MKKLALTFLFFVAVSPAWATTYYLATAAGGGSDSNNGTASTTPWLTPNHPVNCGDVILAAAGTYSEGNFRLGQWGTVNCPAGNNVAWLKCATAFSCNITISVAGHDAMGISQSYWGVQGWVVSVSTFSTNQCFNAYPPNYTTQIHHIIFANDIANGCGDGAFTIGAIIGPPNYGVDYAVFIGNIAYNGAQDNGECYSGIDMVPPTNSDTLPGTHIYIAGNFVWGNVEPNPCAGGLPTDGQGISLDSPGEVAYSGQIVIDNNISIFNGGTGIQSFLNTGNNPNAMIYIRHNTTFGNQTGSINANPCAEINLSQSLSSQVYLNLVQSGTNPCHGSVAEYALGVYGPDSTDRFYDNYIYNAAGNNTTGSGTGFSFGPNNTTGNNPNFMNPVKPGPPSCGGTSSVPNCMATMIANFTPTAAAAAPYGYQVPSAVQTSDPLFPQWLCTVTNLPAGLVTMGCLAQSSLPEAPTIIGVKIQ